MSVAVKEIVDDIIPFEYEEMEFSKDGSLDELIALDRYAIQSYENYKVGDTVVAIVDDKGSKKVGTIKAWTQRDHKDAIIFEDRLGEKHTVDATLIHKPLETRPSQLWTRWAKGGSSVEQTLITQRYWENEFRWLFDGYRYSLGGRIQLMLGQEFVTGVKANLTAYNCFVLKSPETSTDSVTQYLNVLEIAYKEASIMRKGGGCGVNISTINTVEGSGATSKDFVFYLDKNHPDYHELEDRIKLGKFEGVTVVTTKDEYNQLMREYHDTLKKKVDSSAAIDSVDGMFTVNMMEMVKNSYKGKSVFIDFNDLRERYAIVKGVNGRSSGAVSWMELFVLIANLLQQKGIDCVDFAEIFSAITHLIEQGGSRRGALMLICNVTSASVEKFITRKKVSGHLSGANISVGIDEQFMTRVKLGKEALLSDEVATVKANQVEVLGEEVAESVHLWDTIIESAWSSAEPGIVWLERYNNESNSWYFSPIIATNPCNL